MFSFIKKLFCIESDTEFFDKEATIKEYFDKIPPNKRKKVDTYEELYEEALKYVDHQSFQENTQEFNNYFQELEQKDYLSAIAIGFIGFLVSWGIAEKGKKIEKGIDDILPPGFDKNNPFDVKIGKNHRYFGHDIFTFGLRNIKSDFPIHVGKKVCKDANAQGFIQIGKLLGGNKESYSMLDLIWYFYGKNKKGYKLAKYANCLSHVIVHFTKDLLTPEGLPLPFSSLFNKIDIIEDFYFMDNQDSYLLRNEFNDAVNKVKGNMHMSDIGSLSIINILSKRYSHTLKLGNKEKSFNREIKIVAMGTCMMIQMGALVFDSSKRKKVISNAKLNVMMTSSLLNNMIQGMIEIGKVRKGINKEYDYRISQY